MSLTSSLPQFPQFTILSDTDLDVLKNFYPNELGYSDFNLLSIWGYMSQSCRWSTLGQTIIYEFCDYLTNEKFLTFASNNINIDTIEQIINFVKSKKDSYSQVIKLIPESTISTLSGEWVSRYELLLDRDNFDYILDIGDTANVIGSKYESKRHEYNRFVKKNTDYEIMEYSKIHDQLLVDISNLFKMWASEKKLTEWQHEFNSLLRAISNESFLFWIFTLKVGTTFAGFAVIEPISQNTVMLHYWKTSALFTNAYGFLMIEICRILSSRGYSLLNFQQDIGLAHLRESKLRWHPKHFLRKFKVDLSK
jgi:hypothetical protein